MCGLERFLHHHISFCVVAVLMVSGGRFGLTVCDESSKSVGLDLIWTSNLLILSETRYRATSSQCVLTSASRQTRSCESAAQHTVLFFVHPIYWQRFAGLLGIETCWGVTLICPNRQMSLKNSYCTIKTYFFQLNQINFWIVSFWHFCSFGSKSRPPLYIQV